MENEPIEKRVLHLREVEKLSGRQIAKQLGIGSRRVARILNGSEAPPYVKPSLLERYRNLIAHWYKEYPNLKALQIYERLKTYGYQAGYRSVVIFTRPYRHEKPAVYHALDFLPGEEAQIDWFFFRHPKLGLIAGFLYVLSFSRYAWGAFYPRTSFEFFLAGHLECFEHFKGTAHCHRYDNLKSVVLSRRQTEIEYNPQFLDFARFFGFSIHACNPYRGNEKGRVERLVRDARVFLYGENFEDMKELNLKFKDWLIKRNHRIHRSTGKTPIVLLSEERLLALPKQPYPSKRIIPAASVSKTALVEFEGNRYSVPSELAEKYIEIMVYPEILEFWSNRKKVARHPRCFERNQRIQNPLHAESLFNRSSDFKYQRIRQLIENMDPVFGRFLREQCSEEDRMRAAYELFLLLKTNSRAVLVSAVREISEMGCFKMKALRSLLQLPAPKEPDMLWPQDTKLLHLRYEQRELKDYDPPS
jgi:transposase